jgi:hypothetical protein
MNNTESQIKMFGMTRQEMDDMIVEAAEWGDDPSMMAMSICSDIQEELANEIYSKEIIRQKLNVVKYMISKVHKMVRNAA